MDLPLPDSPGSRDELRALAARLRAIRFLPRPSLPAEIAGQLGREPAGRGTPDRRPGVFLGLVGLAVAAGVLLFAFWRFVVAPLR